LDRLPDVDLPRLALGEGPTPVRRLGGAVARGRAEVWLKDDGAYARHGGNKARKLEWLLGEARRRGARTVITGGALGTNHGLATALYARELGLRAVLVLVPQPEDEHVRRQLGLIRATGAVVHRAGGPARGFARAAALLARHSPPLPYLILPGGSTPRGCVGYVEAGLELGRQVRAGELPEPGRIVVAVGSGGTAAGLLLGLRLAELRSRLVCVLVNDLTPVSAAGVARMARRTGSLLRRRGAAIAKIPLGADEVELRREWLGEGYGHPTSEATAATEVFASAGVTLDPVYTAKAGAALLALNGSGALGDGPVLYWHTYGGGHAGADL
jgi:D-cysteine desulfhydrase